MSLTLARLWDLTWRVDLLLCRAQLCFISAFVQDGKPPRIHITSVACSRVRGQHRCQCNGHSSVAPLAQARWGGNVTTTTCGCALPEPRSITMPHMPSYTPIDEAGHVEGPWHWQVLDESLCGDPRVDLFPAPPCRRRLSIQKRWSPMSSEIVWTRPRRRHVLFGCTPNTSFAGNRRWRHLRAHAPQALVFGNSHLTTTVSPQ